jgi:hypothetical protein
MIRKLIPVLLLLAACSNKPEVPENIIAPEKMEAISWDLVRADGLLSSTMAADTLTPAMDKRTQLYSEVLRIHGVTKETFKHSLKFYENRPDLLKIVFTKMTERAQKIPTPKSTDTKKDSM